MSINHPPSSGPQRCPTCGTSLPEAVPPEQCPKCLLAAGLTTAPTEAHRSGPVPTASSSASKGSPSRQALPQPGEQFGHYQIARLLGQGGMGAVFEAEDLETGRRVALKILAHTLDSPEARQRFLREGRLAASITHPNSVYVYGTEEIGGTPVIAMELVPGGTLQERVLRQGPLPVPRAVDAVLQIIAGLETAQALGILHRDVKPSNCFEDGEGTVKIGDFGLSISTLRTDANVTAHGALLGTPAYASPEQLRSQELNARSDIYSVGVTLFYLLTGRTPFQGQSVVQLIANVLEKPAPSPADFRSEIPRELARVVLRCLEKQPGERYRDYGDLRQALAPFSSRAPIPAPLPLRFLAGLVDSLLLGVAGLAICLVAFGEAMPIFASPPLESGRMLALIGGSFLTVLAYYALLEGLWGASPGKALCRLRVVDPSRNPPGCGKAFLRALVFHALPALPYWLVFGPDPVQVLSRGSGWFQNAVGCTYYLLIALLFSSARRRNGFAAWHDLLTNTRITRRFASQARPLLQAVPEALPIPPSQQTVGPYHVLESMGKTSAGEWFLGYDTRLLRKVWIRVLSPGTPPVPKPLRQIGRPGRLRWIAGRRLDDENWDAFESLPGLPLLRLAADPRPWDQVRFWLLDLATELHAAQKDGSVPPVLALDRVWITADGRAMLLDFPAPTLPANGDGAGLEEPGPRTATTATAPGPVGQQPGGGIPPTEAERYSRFLNEVAQAGFHGIPDLRRAAVPLPLAARDVLRRLPRMTGLDQMLDALRSLVQQPPAVSRLRRFGLVVGCAAFPIFTALGMTFGTYALERWEREQPGVWELSQLLAVRSSRNLPWAPRGTGPDDRVVAVYIASQYRPLITNSSQWQSAYALSMIKGANRRFAEQSLADHPAPTEEEVDEAVLAIEPLLARFATDQVVHQPWFPAFAAGFALMIYVALPALLAALCFRGGLILRALRVAVVRRDGEPASRWRVCWRAMVTWAPFVLWPIALAWLRPALGPSGTAVVLVGTALTLVVWSVLLPKRSLQDRLAGTFLVPR